MGRRWRARHLLRWARCHLLCWACAPHSLSWVAYWASVPRCWVVDHLCLKVCHCGSKTVSCLLHHPLAVVLELEASARAAEAPVGPSPHQAYAEDQRYSLVCSCSEEGPALASPGERRVPNARLLSYLPRWSSNEVAHQHCAIGRTVLLPTCGLHVASRFHGAAMQPASPDETASCRLGTRCCTQSHLSIRCTWIRWSAGLVMRLQCPVDLVDVVSHSRSGTWEDTSCTPSQ
mmetsp:Transcript_22961/g.44107  ORF Transcript_22961/g.44107 Transcript_22961/m.44107 type:complete len:232 (+) Transcript_22961:1443-2138(+)